MKLVTDHYDDSAKEVGDDRVYFRTEDGRAMFEVRAGKDGRSIEVRGVEACKVDGKLYREQLSIEPVASNAITIRTITWEL